jgi:hypothetical protein
VLIYENDIYSQREIKDLHPWRLKHYIGRKASKATTTVCQVTKSGDKTSVIYTSKTNHQASPIASASLSRLFASGLQVGGWRARAM